MFGEGGQPYFDSWLVHVLVGFDHEGFFITTSPIVTMDLGLLN